MKRILFLLTLVFSLATLAAEAQTSYYVSSLHGDVTLKQGKKATVLKLRDRLTENSQITVPASGLLVLLDVKNRRQYTINTPASGTVQSIISKKDVASKELTHTYFRYLWNKMTSRSESSVNSTYMQQYGASLRDGNEAFEDSVSASTAVPDSVCH